MRKNHIEKEQLEKIFDQLIRSNDAVIDECCSNMDDTDKMAERIKCAAVERLSYKKVWNIILNSLGGDFENE